MVVRDDYSESQRCGCGRFQMLEPMQHGMSVYCSCGRIMDLDRQEMEFKICLGKELECSRCRNLRIGREIELLNAIFSGLVDEDGCATAEMV